MYVSNISYLPCSLHSVEKFSSFVREYSLIEMLKWISSTCDVGVSCWAHVLLLLRSLSIVKDISHGNGTSTLSSSVLSCCRWQLTLNGKCLWRTWNCLSSSRATSLPENSHKMSLEAQVKQMEPTGRGERGDLAGNGLISYCVATCAFCSYDWIFNSICCTNISTSLPPFPSPFLSILLRAKSLRCWQTFLF